MTVEGPGWCEPGLDVRGGMYPLAVESAVLRMVDRLVPGVSTQTYLARYYSLYWAIADIAGQRDLDAAACRQLVRRAEAALGWASIWNPETGALDGPGGVHGSNRIRALVEAGVAETMAAEGTAGVYSPRAWGFWSQYGGSCITVGAVSVHKTALRPGPARCPEVVTDLFAPLLTVCVDRPVRRDELEGIAHLAHMTPDAVDAQPLSELLLGQPCDGRAATGNDVTRRAAFRILGRGAQIAGDDSDKDWTDLLRAGVAYGDLLETDPVLAREERAPAWRGTALRHHTVGAWRVLWADLVEVVMSKGGNATKNTIYAWARGGVRDGTVRDFVANLPSIQDAHGNPLPAEAEIGQDHEAFGPFERQLAVLLLGAQRDRVLEDTALKAFRGGRIDAHQFLDPGWIGERCDAYLDRPLAEFACVIVDDMLAQSRRVALRKTTIDTDGHMTTFTKLHEREGIYFASGSEGRENVSLRVDQLGGLLIQLGHVERTDDNKLRVTPRGLADLDLPT